MRSFDNKEAKMNFFDQVEKGYTFDDVCLVPEYSNLNSRNEVDISSTLFDIKYSLPIISANMSSITEEVMINKICEFGGTGALHRYLSPEDVFKKFSHVHHKQFAGISVGVRDEYFQGLIKAFDNFKENSPGYIIIDIAHGHHKLCIDMIKKIKDTTNLGIIAGNICTPEAAYALSDAGADVVKVGVSPGAQCETRKTTGIGYPQLSAIKNIAEAVKGTNIKIIADGGCRYTGDIVKALAAGAHFVMLGNMLAGTKETPGKVISLGTNNDKFKIYEGMASTNAQINFSGGEAEDIAAEGTSSLVSYKGSVDKVLKNISKSIKHGLSYVGCRNLEELHRYGNRKDSWVIQTISGYIEGTSHGNKNRAY